MAAMGEMPWNKLLAQSVCLFLNRHWQFGVYPSKIQVTHIPTNPIRVDFTSQHPCPPWLCSLLSFCLSNRWKWVLACFSAPFSLRTRGDEHLFICLDFTLWAVWLESGERFVYCSHLCMVSLPNGKEKCLYHPTFPVFHWWLLDVLF